MSFSVLIWTWSNYSRLVGHLAVESDRLFSLNVVLLFTVSLEPYLLHILWVGVVNGGDELVLDLSSIAYALDLGFLFGILGWMTYLIARNPGVGLEPGEREHLFRVAQWRGAMALLFAVTILPIFWSSAVTIGGTVGGVTPLIFRLRYAAWIVLVLLAVLPSFRGPRDPSPHTRSDAPRGP